MSIGSPGSVTAGAAGATTRLVVAGAHLHGEPLHPDLLALGARFLCGTRTAPEYRMVALPPVPATPGRPPLPARPGLIRDPDGGRAVDVEVYELPVAALGDLLLTVAPPLAIGTVALADGGQAPGFVCEGHARDGVPDISHFGGWRRYRASLGAGDVEESERATSG
jgi:allophanate hydrolase